jgi:hypothetical protein
MEVTVDTPMIYCDPQTSPTCRRSEVYWIPGPDAKTGVVIPKGWKYLMIDGSLFKICPECYAAGPPA